MLKYECRGGNGLEIELNQIQKIFIQYLWAAKFPYRWGELLVPAKGQIGEGFLILFFITFHNTILTYTYKYTSSHSAWRTISVVSNSLFTRCNCDYDFLISITGLYGAQYKCSNGAIATKSHTAYKCW